MLRFNHDLDFSKIGQISSKDIFSCIHQAKMIYKQASFGVMFVELAPLGLLTAGISTEIFKALGGTPSELFRENQANQRMLAAFQKATELQDMPDIDFRYTPLGTLEGIVDAKLFLYYLLSGEGDFTTRSFKYYICNKIVEFDAENDEDAELLVYNFLNHLEKICFPKNDHISITTNTIFMQTPTINPQNKQTLDDDNMKPGSILQMYNEL